jgi:SAM-dependent methyltransferase
MDRGPAARRALLAKGSLEHYDDPAYYQKTYENRIDDVAFYVARAKSIGGPVLEYGIGHGRIAIPIARHGVEVFGIDHSEPMLGTLAGRVAKEKLPIDFVRGDMRTLSLGRKFPLVIAPFNVLLHLYNRGDVENFFARVREHLAKGGRFVCDLSTPSLADLSRNPKLAYGLPPFKHPSHGVIRYKEYFDYDPVTQVLVVRMCFRPKKGKAFETLLTHRQFYPAEWEALMHYNGFEIEERYGDFSGGPLVKESDEMVYVAKKK